MIASILTFMGGVRIHYLPVYGDYVYARLIMDDYTIAGLIGVFVFLVSFVIAVLITVKSKY